MYRVRLTDTTLRRLKREVPAHLKHRIADLITGLESNPRPDGAALLRGHTHIYRIRLDGWRIIYHVAEDEVRVAVTEEGNEDEGLVTVLDVLKKTGPETTFTPSVHSVTG